MTQKRCYAFISYSHKDIKIAKWLHKKLESYKLPSEIHNEFENSKYLRPIFRDQEDLSTGILSNELRKHLEQSKYLVIVCSPNSAKSNWVSDEVQAFIEWGRLEYIIPFIIDGTPNSGDNHECLPKSLLDYVKHHPDKELLGINIAETGREKAFVRVVSKMLDVSFDELWKRHKREKKRKILISSITVPFVVTLLYYLAVPVSLTIKIKDDNHLLPLPENAVLSVNNAEYTIDKLDTTLIINNLPGYYKNRKLRVRLSPKWYIPINEFVCMGWGTNTSLKKTLQRDNTFSTFSGKVIDENGNPIAKATLSIEDIQTQTNKQGKFSINFPIAKQSITKDVYISKDGYEFFCRKDECPDTCLIYILRKYQTKNL